MERSLGGSHPQTPGQAGRPLERDGQVVLGGLGCRGLAAQPGSATQLGLAAVRLVQAAAWHCHARDSRAKDPKGRYGDCFWAAFRTSRRMVSECSPLVKLSPVRFAIRFAAVHQVAVFLLSRSGWKSGAQLQFHSQPVRLRGKTLR